MLEIAPAAALVVQSAAPSDPSRLGRSGAERDAQAARDRGDMTLPELLAREPGVLMQQTSPAAGAPIMRGMVGPQVLILVDGLRLNNALWRTGPVQYLNAVNLQAVDRIEIMRGPDSARYGGGALGGVIHLHTHDPGFVDEGFALHGDLAGGYSSADEGKTLRAQADLQGAQLGGHIGGDLAEFANLRGGRGTGIQADSSYKRGDLDAKVLWAPGPGQRVSAGFLSLHQYDAPRPDKCTRDALGQVIDCRQRKEQSIDLAHLRWDMLGAAFFDQAQALVGVQNFAELGERERRDKGRFETTLDQDLVLSGQVYGVHVLRPLAQTRLRLGFGAELSHEIINAHAWRTTSPLRAPLGADPAATDPAHLDPSLATVANDSRYTSMAIYTQQKWLIGSDLSLNAGLRYSGYQVQAPQSERLNYALDRSFAAPSASLAAEYHALPWLFLAANLSHAYRAPNIYDLTGRDFFGGGFEFADASSLGPERLSGAELITRLRLGALHVEVSAYANLLHTLIVRQPTDFKQVSIYQGAQTFARVNSGRAWIYGAEASAELALGRLAHIYSQASYTYGQDISNDEPLSRIPPPMGLVGLSGQPLPTLRLGSELQWVLAQERLSARDIADSRIPQDGTPGYFFVDLFASYRVLPALHISARLHNLFDASYRVHGSGVDGAGVQGRLALRVIF